MTKADEFREYAEEAIQWSRQSRTEEEKKALNRPCRSLGRSCGGAQGEGCGPLGPDARMSGDTFLTIIAVSLTAIFISVFAIECDRVWQRYRASRRRRWKRGPGLTVSKTKGGPMTRSDRVGRALFVCHGATLEEAKAQFQKSWDALEGRG